MLPEVVKTAPDNLNLSRMDLQGYIQAEIAELSRYKALIANGQFRKYPGFSWPVHWGEDNNEDQFEPTRSIGTVIPSTQESLYDGVNLLRVFVNRNNPA